MDGTNVETLKMGAGAVLRSAATGWGGWLLAHGLLQNAGDENAFIGAVMVLGALGWSVGQKYGHAVAAAALKKLTGEDSVKAAVEVAKVAAPGAAKAALMLAVAGALSLSLFASGSARAADLPVKAPAVRAAEGVPGAAEDASSPTQ